MLTHEPEKSIATDTMIEASIPLRERCGRPDVESLLAAGCRQEVNGCITKVVGSGEGFKVKETVLRPRFRQGV